MGDSIRGIALAQQQDSKAEIRRRAKTTFLSHST
jgi:hypothetical protein